jgi:hypothetical protein
MVVLAVVNLAMFETYRKAHPDQNIWTQLWEYVESGAFKVLTVSLLLPIFLLFLEGSFRIVETVEKSRLGRLRRENEERREKRWQGIELTSQMWNQLYDLASEVRYFSVGPAGEPGIRGILQKVANFPNSAEDVVNMWRFRFELRKEYQKVFLVFINTLLHSTETVAHCLADSENTKECEHLQNCLGVIQEGIKTIAHHPIIVVLTHCMELMERKEDRESSDQAQIIQSTIDDRLKKLREWAEALKEEQMTHNKIFPAMPGPEVEAFRRASGDVVIWMRNHPGKPLDDYERFDDFGGVFNEIPIETLIHGWKIVYSKEFVRHLADWLAFQSTCQDLTEMAR